MSTSASTFGWKRSRRSFPDVERLSYYQVANKFLPTLSFDAVELTGEIRKEWLTWVRTTVERQLGDEPLSIKDLDQSIADRKAEIERERLAKRRPGKGSGSGARSCRREGEGGASSLAEQGLQVDRCPHGRPRERQRRGGACPEGSSRRTISNCLASWSVFDPAKCTTDDCITLAKAMCAAGKLVEMKYL